MPIAAEARVLTDRPGRYLTQLCKHFSNKGRHLGHRPRSHQSGEAPASRETHGAPDIQPDQIQVEWSETHGMLSLPWGRCTMDAESGALVLLAEAKDEEALQRIQDLLTAHVARFSRREELQVEWRRLEMTTPAEGPAGDAETAHAFRKPPSLRRKHLTWAGIAILVALAVVLHLGVAGAVLSAAGWTGWVVWGALAAVAVKVTLVSVWGHRMRRRSRRQVG